MEGGAESSTADASAQSAPVDEAAASPAPPQPGHSQHGGAFDEGPRQKAYLIGGTGDVHFSVSTKSPLAQQFFDQGVGQLHGFWYYEAERSFRQVAALDPDCAMAYWGLAMANVKNEKRAKKFIDVAVQKIAQVTPRERLWIAALAAARTGEDSIPRRRKYVRDLEALVQDDPKDVEAKAFLALEIWSNGSWMTDEKLRIPISSHQAVDALLDQVFAAQPMHPAHHYRIHLWDDEKPERALLSASLCGQSAPSVAHMWHMPGHTYSKLHRYADAAWQQEASARVDHAQMMRDRVLPDQIHNYAHNSEWLIRNLAFLGRVGEAIELAKNMIEMPRLSATPPDKGKFSSDYGYERLIDVLVQFECWQEIVAYSDSPYFPVVGDSAEEQLKRTRLLGVAAFGLGNVEAGQKQVLAIEELLRQKRTARLAAAEAAEQKARDEKKPDQEAAKAVADVLVEKGKSLQSIEQALDELRGYAALAAGDQAQARLEFDKLKETSAIRKEHLARAVSLAGDHAEAEKLARGAVTSGPNEVYPLAVLIDVLQRAGKAAEAQAEFNTLRTLAADTDLDREVFRRLQPVAVQLSLPTDWRIPRETPADAGVRPELANLGPIRWEPAPAPNWTLVGADSASVSLEQFHGRPVVLIFYLGAGCLHCVEQLQKFAPLTSDFAAAGISLAAISTEGLESLKASLATLSPDESVRFPLAADPELGVFKAYRAFDDFENMPLHATVLVDAQGLVRWQNISAEPFMDAKFLLDEAKRLLPTR
ncbi:MAG: peroxiredoxin family protein [Pirellulales bacterium]|nr:peroxiredoxin family protein [Pirellulales bacterium]